MATAREVIGRSGSVNSDTESVRVWASYNAANEVDATAAVVSAAPTNIGALVIDNITYAEKVENHFECEVMYRRVRRQEQKQKGESSFSFEFQTTPTRVYLPIGTQQVYKRSSDSEPTPVIHIIGDQGIPNQPPEGVEVYEPTHVESETHYFDQSLITLAYKQQVKRLIGKVNNSFFKGHAAGEVLLTAVSGSQRGYDDWEVSYHWSVRENQMNVTSADITVDEKKGWEYIWPRYILEEDENGAPCLSQQIRYLVKAKVFRTDDLSLLNIGA